MQSIIKHQFVTVEGTPSPALPRRGPLAHQESVELVRLGGEVKALVVRCACGKTITVELEYETRPSEVT